jgi:hypothetical protein
MAITYPQLFYDKLESWRSTPGKKSGKVRIIVTEAQQVLESVSCIGIAAANAPTTHRTAGGRTKIQKSFIEGFQERNESELFDATTL